MSNWVTRALATGSISGVVAYAWHHAILPFIIPLGTPVVIGTVARLQGFPWTEVLVFSLVAFAAMSHGLLRFDEWRERRRPEHKLTFATCRFSRSIRNDGYALGVQVSSTAPFPIELEIVELRTRIDNNVPPANLPQARKLIVPPRGTAWWDDGIIAVAVPRPGILQGSIEFRLKYGHAGSLKYDLNGRKQAHVAFDANGQVASVAWSDIV